MTPEKKEYLIQLIDEMIVDSTERKWWVSNILSTPKSLNSFEELLAERILEYEKNKTPEE